jgi:hypothetical protein
MEDKILLDERRFLNKNGYHSTASIAITITREEDQRSPLVYSSGIYAEFTFTDCVRGITLDMDTNSEKDLDNSLFKLRQIAESCQKAIAVLEGQRGFIKEHDKKVKEKEE